MKIFDLSHPIFEKMPTYFGAAKPKLKIQGSVKIDGHREMDVKYNSHIGTHIDLPAHMLTSGKTIDKMPIEEFFGRGIKINVRNIFPNKILVSDLKKYHKKIPKIDFILLHSGHSKFWGKEKYFYNFPVLDNDAAKWLCDFNLKGIGIDMLSIDATDSKDYSNHKIFLKNEILIIENLTNLDKIPNEDFYFSCIPLNIKNADGSPVRAIAIVIE